MRIEKKELLPTSMLVWIVMAMAGLPSLLSAENAKETPKWEPNRVDFAMYFHSEVKDAPECSMDVQDGRIVFGQGISNPSMTCPDMFSWKLFTEVVQDRFWSKWADEDDNWPAKPYRLCEPGESPKTAECCKPKDPNNDPCHCPKFPGDAEKTTVRYLQNSLREHLFGPLESGPGADLGTVPEVTSECGKPRDKVVRSCSEYPLPDHIESIGRVIRFTNGELTVRNEAFHDYLFQNDLYNADGVIAVFQKNHQNVWQRSPYRVAPVASHSASQGISKIDFPSDSIMIKSNWMNAELLERIGEKYGWDSAHGGHSYIAKEMKQELSLREKDKDGKDIVYDCSGKHYLMAFHISSKDIPNWVWTTFEHVNLPGRCDITGCNDSWGYASSDPDIPDGAADNYVRPKVRVEKAFSDRRGDIFRRDQIYAAEQARPQLTNVFEALGIGTGSKAGDHPAAQDPAWLNYRLKGSQVEYVDATGRPTFLGNSVTEAGFIDGSSCMTCHARAGADKFGPSFLARGTGGQPQRKPAGVRGLPLGVFLNDLSDFGYARSAFGAPDPNWFYGSTRPASLKVMQTDFVWGFFHASPLDKAKSGERSGRSQP